MSDVRLVGTNPEDGSLVPVAVTPAGLLKTEVGTIEEVPNDLLVSGNLTVTGTINGQSGGGVELPPNPSPGQVLGWENGELVWITLPDPQEPAEGLPLPLGDEGSVLQVVRGEAAWGFKAPVPLPDVVWSNFVTLVNPSGTWGASNPASLMFDGLTTTYCIANAGSQGILFKPFQDLGVIEKVEVMCDSGGMGPYNGWLNNVRTPLNGDSTWEELLNVSGQVWDVNTELKIERSGADNWIRVKAVRFNGTVLVDDGLENTRLLRGIMARLEALEAAAE